MKVEFDQCGVVSVEATVHLWLRTDSSSVYRGNVPAELSPAEARLLGQTLIAAADVAERFETMEAT